jgi:hypothetical protein
LGTTLKREFSWGEMMATKPDYAGLVEQAEKAVRGVTDPELRRIAFQKVLEDLLGGGISSSVKSSPAEKVTGKAPVKRRSRRAKAAGTGPKAYITELIDEGFFKKPKTITAVKVELGNRGHHIPLTSLSTPLIRLTKAKALRRSKGDKNTFLYSNW